MARKKKNTTQPKLEDIESKEVEKVEEKKPKGKQYKVRKDLGFEKRNYFIGRKNVVLIAGETVDKETYELFNDYCKKTFFEA